MMERVHASYLARRHVELAIETLAQIAGNPEAENQSRISAARELLDRGYGKSTEHVQIDDEPEVSVQSIDARTLIAETHNMLLLAEMLDSKERDDDSD